MRMNGAAAMSLSPSAIASRRGAVRSQEPSVPSTSGLAAGSMPWGACDIWSAPAQPLTLAMTFSAYCSRCLIFVSSGSVSGPLM